MPMKHSPIITGIICTHNRERYLKRCIESLLVQSLDSDLYEILVVDNGSTDQTREICDSFQHHPNFSYVFEPEIGLSSARNAGWRHARGSYVGYLDDDATAAKYWFENALSSFENVDPAPDWVGGPIDLEWEVESPAWITPEHWVTLGYIDWGSEARFLTEPAERLGGGNSFYPRSLLEDMQGFDTRLGRKKNLLLSGEETQFQHRLKARNGLLYYHPEVRIYHSVAEERTRPGFFYRRYYWGGITDYLMSKTLQGVEFEHIAQPEYHGSRLHRLMGNTINALGVFRSQEDIVRSRIYLSYVAGQLVAIVRFGWRRFDLDQG